VPADPARVATARQMLAHLGVTLADLQADPGPGLPALAEYLLRVGSAGPVRDHTTTAPIGSRAKRGQAQEPTRTGHRRSALNRDAGQWVL
jgi:hypothetical protein